MDVSINLGMYMNKADIYHFLMDSGIPFEKMEHQAVYNMEEMQELHLPHPEAEAKNLFVRDDKKQNYYLITVMGEKRVDLKAFQRENGTRRLSFASDTDLMDKLGLIPGAVSPLGILNDSERKVIYYIDSGFTESACLIGIHPNDNTATVWMNPDDLIRIIREHGNTVNIIAFD